MGFTERISWSHSRSKLRGGCPRAYFWQYFAKGEPEARQANLLKKLTSIDMMVGQAVDWAITASLDDSRQGAADAFEGIVERGLKTFDRLYEASPKICDYMKRNGYPSQDSQPLVHHYYGTPLPTNKLAECKDKVTTCLTNFGQSAVLQEILAIDPSDWCPPKGDSVPSFRIPKTKVTVYANYDFYFRRSLGEVLIIDWKSGKPSKEADKEASAQLSVYALFGVYALRRPWTGVKVLTAWLSVGQGWTEEAPSFEAQKSMHDRIIREHSAEVESVKLDEGLRKVPVYVAAREDYPPKPEASVCRKCKFRELCPEGQAAVGA